MSSFQPMRYNCDTSGCFNLLRRLNFGHFYDCFPGRISMSDIDATVEVNGRFLFLEMKSHQGVLPTGQRIYFERLTALSPNIVAMIVCGDTQAMDCRALCWVYAGRTSDWQPTSLADVKALLCDFTEWASGPRLAA